VKAVDIIPVEDHPAGYPRFAALIASHDSFYIYRRFSLLRAQLLLLKQDRLSQLELRLQKVNQEETQPLHLGSCRRDKNPERQLILSEIDSALADYGKPWSLPIQISLTEVTGIRCADREKWSNHRPRTCCNSQCGQPAQLGGREWLHSKGGDSLSSTCRRPGQCPPS